MDKTSERTTASWQLKESELREKLGLPAGKISSITYNENTGVVFISAVVFR